MTRLVLALTVAAVQLPATASRGENTFRLTPAPPAVVRVDPAQRIVIPANTDGNVQVCTERQSLSEGSRLTWDGQTLVEESTPPSPILTCAVTVADLRAKEPQPARWNYMTVPVDGKKPD